MAHGTQPSHGGGPLLEHPLARLRPLPLQASLFSLALLGFSHGQQPSLAGGPLQPRHGGLGLRGVEHLNRAIAERAAGLSTRDAPAERDAPRGRK